MSGKIIIAVLVSTILLFDAALAESSQSDTIYRLVAGDRVRVTVYGHEDMSGDFEVDAQGQLVLPLVKDIVAAGRSLEELQAIVTDKLKPDYLKDPHVRVEMLNYRPFYIFGEINVPGSYEYIDGMTIINAVAVAGGFTHRAQKEKIKIVRELVSGSTAEVSSRRLKASQDTPILPGDVIEIPERLF